SLPGPLPEYEFVIDQAEQRFTVTGQARESFDVRLDPNPIAGGPTPGLVLEQLPKWRGGGGRGGPPGGGGGGRRGERRAGGGGAAGGGEGGAPAAEGKRNRAGLPTPPKWGTGGGRPSSVNGLERKRSEEKAGDRHSDGVCG